MSTLEAMSSEERKRALKRERSRRYEARRKAGLVGSPVPAPASSGNVPVPAATDLSAACLHMVAQIINAADTLPPSRKAAYAAQAAAIVEHKWLPHVIAMMAIQATALPPGMQSDG